MFNRIFSVSPAIPLHIFWLMSIPALANYWSNSMDGFWITAFAGWVTLSAFISFVFFVMSVGWILNPHAPGGRLVRVSQAYINKSEQYGIFWFTYLARTCMCTMSGVFIYMSYTELVAHNGFMSLVWYVCACLYPRLHQMLLHALNPDSYRVYKVMQSEVRKELNLTVKNYFNRNKKDVDRG